MSLLPIYSIVTIPNLLLEAQNILRMIERAQAAMVRVVELNAIVMSE